MVPPEVRRTFRLSDPELQEELFRLTDAFTDELFTNKLSPARPIIYPVSRVVVDPERFADDEKEPMAKNGMGAVYTHTSQGEKLRVDLSAEERKRLMESYYKPQHEKLTAAVNEALQAYGTCLIIDCHSFPSVPLPYEPDQSPERPDICIGTDTFHTPEWLAKKFLTLFRDTGYSVEENRPYSGSIVPAAFYRVNKNVYSIMIEVNRKLYLNEHTGQKSKKYRILDKSLTLIFQEIEYIVERMF